MSPLTRILFVSYCFPPDSQVGARRIARLCRYLPEFEIVPVVLTVEEKRYRDVDRNFMPPPGVEVIGTEEPPNVLDFYRRLKTSPNSAKSGGLGSHATAPSRSRGLVRRTILDLLQVGGPAKAWLKPALQAGSHLLAGGSFDAIVSSGPPFVAHQIARQLKERFNLPWLADFRDPWALDPDVSELPEWRRAIDRKRESACIQAADRVILNTERMRDLYKQTYSSQIPSKFVTLTNGFEEMHSPVQIQAQAGNPFTCLHLGEVYAARRIDSFCEALARFVVEGRIRPESFRVVFQGGIDSVHIEAARRIAPGLVEQGLIQFRPRVGWNVAERELWSADLLLIIQGGFRYSVPAKFYEYLATGKPIFAVTQEGALSDVLEETASGSWAAAGDSGMIAARLLEAMKLPQRSAAEAQQLWAAKYHFRNLAGRLADWIRELTTARAPAQARLETQASAK